MLLIQCLSPSLSSDLQQAVPALVPGTEGLCDLGQSPELTEPMCKTGTISNPGIKQNNVSK